MTKGKGIGNFEDASVFSFYITKMFNTIEGGAATFLDHRIYEKLYNLKNFGIRSEELVAEVGANVKMNEFAAIMGLCKYVYPLTFNQACFKNKYRNTKLVTAKELANKILVLPLYEELEMK